MNDNIANIAPIVLFTYNRPEHTEKTLTALKNNLLAKLSTLYIYCDGPKNPDNKELIEKVKKVREIASKEKWCRKVHILESDSNRGLADSIRSGVTDVVTKHGKVIVLEDDLITSPAFLTYMNKALIFYEKYKSVFSISGYCLPPKKFTVPEYYNYDVFAGLRNSSWGWATWQDRWNRIDWDVKVYDTIKNNIEIRQAFNRGGDDVFDLLEMQQTGKLNIWSIQFTVAHFLNHAISIIPVESYVNNIGHDGSGENCYASTGLEHKHLCQKMEYRFLDIIYQDKNLINAFYNAYCRKKRPVWQKMINRLSRIVGGKNKFILKKKIYS